MTTQPHTLGADWALAWIRECAKVVHEQREALTDLDRAIGDADHGENLDRGFQAVIAKLDGQECALPADVLKVTAQTLISTVGGASGPLLGTAFLRAAKACPEAVDGPGAAAILQAALDGIQARGKAKEGEKTMVDAWAPAAKAAADAAEADKTDAAAVLQAAADAARDGAQATTPMTATKGRASYLGERSQGHQDPGATSSSYLIAAAAATASADS